MAIYAQKIWLRHRNYFRFPKQAAREELRENVKTWLSNRENIIIYIDTNKIIRKGTLVKQLKHLGFKNSLEEKYGHL